MKDHTADNELSAFMPGSDAIVPKAGHGDGAECPYANLFMGQGEFVYTPVANGTFLNDIRRQRAISLLRASPVAVIEHAISFAIEPRANEPYRAATKPRTASIAPSRFWPQSRPEARRGFMS